MGEQREIETKYEVTPETPVPDLAALSGVAFTSTDPMYHLTAVYYDTDELDLARRRITLRRRTGGKDDGWHLKLPEPDGGGAAPGRTEVTVVEAARILDCTERAVWQRAKDGRLTRTQPGRVSLASVLALRHSASS